MTALENHVWGVSRGADRVWAQVTGLRPSLADERRLMVFQAFIDDSGKGDLFVLAGYIASAEKWAAFSKEWERLLPLAKLGPSGKRRFKMTEMFSTAEGRERTAAFYRVIENNLDCSFSITMKISEFRRALKRIRVNGEELDWPGWNPYQYAFRTMIDTIHRDKEAFKQYIPVTEPIDFIFDRQAERGTLMQMWDGYIKTAPKEIRDRYGAVPRFEDDEEFLPLQAADLWAWSVRWWTERGIPEKARNPDYGEWGSKKEDGLVTSIAVTEAGMVHYFSQMAKKKFGPLGAVVTDVGAIAV